jgi:hypothetical protein
MPAIALTHLQEQIEAVRREAYAEGYEAAMHAIREFVAHGAPAAPEPAPEPTARAQSRRAAGTKRAAKPRSAPEPRRASATRRAAKAGDARAEPAEPRVPRGRRPAVAAQRPQRGTNARLIEEVLQAIAPRSARPTEIRDVLRRAKGVTMAFTSIRHALGQLEARRAVEQVADSKTWRSLNPGDAKGNGSGAADTSQS